MGNVVRLLSTLALMGAVRNLADRFETDTGTRIDADFAPTIGLLERLRNGEGADVLILTKEALDDLAAKGTVAPMIISPEREKTAQKRKNGGRAPGCVWAS